MKTILNVECMDQELIVTNSPVIASGGVHENFIAFNFCEKWDGFGKTAVFYRNENNKYYSVVDVDGMCEIPHEVTANEGTMYFGVFGELNGITKTSNILKYKVKQGAILVISEEPTPDIYQQLLSAYGQTNEAIAKETAERKASMMAEASARNSAILAEENARKQADATEKAERQAEIAVERARINQLTKMGEGSTTGDAELMDIRVDASGQTHESAGEAVRSQYVALNTKIDDNVGQLSSEIANVYKQYKSSRTIDMFRGYVEPTDGTTKETNTSTRMMRSGGRITFNKGDMVAFNTDKKVAIVTYNSSNAYSGYIVLSDGYIFNDDIYGYLTVTIDTTWTDDMITLDTISFAEYSIQEYFKKVDSDFVKSLKINKSAYSFDVSSVDLNDAEVNTILYFTNVTKQPLNSPSDIDLEYYYVITFETGAFDVLCKQIILDESLKGKYTRTLLKSGWGDWKKTEDSKVRQVVEIGEGKQFSALKSGFEYANSIGNCDIYVYDGVYDIIAEYGGNDYFANLSESDVYNNPGLFVGKGNHIIFSSGAKVLCHYTGDNQYVQMHFSPFNANVKLSAINGDFSIENLNAESSRVKYTFHDEYNGASIEYTHKFKNCKMYHDNTNNDYRDTTQCLGGGLGTHGYIEIDGCIFDGVPINDQNITMSYHNGVTEGCKSNIHVKNCVSNGTFYLQSYGVSEDITTMVVSGCKLGSEPYKSYTNNPPYSTVDNTELIAFNNTIN